MLATLIDKLLMQTMELYSSMYKHYELPLPAAGVTLTLHNY